MTEQAGASQPAAPHAEAAAEPTAEELFEQKGIRLAKRERLIDSGAEAYPVSVPITSTIASVREKYADLEIDTASGDIVGLAGRIVHARNTGKLCFASLQAGDGTRIQAMISLAKLGKNPSMAGKSLLTSATTFLFLER